MILRRAALAATSLVIASPAGAHVFGARYDLPLPLRLYLAAAAAAVAISFLGSVLFLGGDWTRRLSVDVEVPRFASQLLSRLLALAGMLTLVVLLGAAFLGPREAVRNLATVGVWVIWWVGFLLFSSLVISLWPRLDPFRRVAAFTTRLAGRDWDCDRYRLPDAAGLLAPAGLLVIAWVELISDWSEDPFAMGLLIIVYLLTGAAGGFIFGPEWFRLADPLSRIFELLGRMAPMSISGRSAFRLRLPGDGLLWCRDPPRGEAALVTGLIGIVIFDGLSETPAWAAVLEFFAESPELRPALLWLRESDVDLLKAIRSAGLLGTVAAFFGMYWLLVCLMQVVTGASLSRRHLAALFAGALLPIGVAYHLAHYVSYLLVAGQLILPASSDPFGLGWDLFGTRDRPIDIGIIGAEQVWWIAFAALVAGHSLSVLIGHRRAIDVFGTSRRAVLSQIPMTVAMVGLTVLGLWILSQPITE